MSKMNSMNSLITSIGERFDLIHSHAPDSRQLIVDVEAKQMHGLLAYLRASGFRQLSLATCVDWIEENEFQLVFIVLDWDSGIHVLARTRINREEPTFGTITGIYPGAQYYERDIHEFFGVVFEGNPMALKPLFLELWDEMPPMRKDFDPLAYSQEKFPERAYVPQFVTKVEVDKP